MLGLFADTSLSWISKCFFLITVEKVELAMNFFLRDAWLEKKLSVMQDLK